MKITKHARYRIKQRSRMEPKEFRKNVNECILFINPHRTNILYAYHPKFNGAFILSTNGIIITYLNNQYGRMHMDFHMIPNRSARKIKRLIKKGKSFKSRLNRYVRNKRLDLRDNRNNLN